MIWRARFLKDSLHIFTTDGTFEICPDDEVTFQSLLSPEEILEEKAKQAQTKYQPLDSKSPTVRSEILFHWLYLIYKCFATSFQPILAIETNFGTHLSHFSNYRWSVFRSPPHTLWDTSKSNIIFRRSRIKKSSVLEGHIVKH